MNIIKRIDLLNNYYKQIVITISNFSNNSQRIEKVKHLHFSFNIINDSNKEVTKTKYNT